MNYILQLKAKDYKNGFFKKRLNYIFFLQEMKLKYKDRLEVK